MSQSLSKKVSGQNDTIALAVFAFSLIWAYVFLSMHSHENMLTWISEHLIQSFMLALSKILKILTEIRDSVRV